MIPPLMVRDRRGPVPVEGWLPTEQPGLALVHFDDDNAWRLIHIRSGLTVAGCEDRALLLDLGLPALAHVDFTQPAAVLAAAHPGLGKELRLLGLYLPGRVMDDPSDLDQHPALAPLTGRPAA